MTSARVALLVFSLLAAAGCRKETRVEPAQDVASVAASAAPLTVAANAFRDETGKVACPVMGDEIASNEEIVAEEEYKGKTYYFCCKSCVSAFKKDPDKYADGRFLLEKKAKESECGHGDPSSDRGRSCE